MIYSGYGSSYDLLGVPDTGKSSGFNQIRI